MWVIMANRHEVRLRRRQRSHVEDVHVMISSTSIHSPGFLLIWGEADAMGTEICGRSSGIEGRAQHCTGGKIDILETVDVENILKHEGVFSIDHERLKDIRELQGLGDLIR